MRGPTATAGEHAPSSPFELFFDLVFVFAITRVTSLVIEHPTPEGVGRGLLVLALLWWAWGAYTWLMNAVGTERAGARVVILAAMGAMLIVGIAVPEAAGANALAFALAYLVVRALHVVLYAVASGAANRAAILRLAPGNLAASALLVVGVFTPGAVQLSLWTAAVLIDYGTPVVTGVAGFAVRAGHFLHRHHHVVLIGLGETTVAIGLGVLHSGGRITPGLTASVVLALGAIAGVWWAYFHREVDRTWRVFTATTGAARARMARDLFSYLHLPLFVGIVFLAVGLEAVMADPAATLHGVDALGLGGGVAVFLLGLTAVRARRGDPPLWAHVAGAVVCVLLVPLSCALPGLASLAVLVGVLLAVAGADRARRAAGPAPGREAVAAPG